MTAIREGELAFSFSADWRAGKYDEWAFYRNQLGKRLQGTKGADIVAVARAALRRSRLRVVLHIEQPRISSKLFARPFDPANVRQKMRQLLKAIDPHPCVVDMQRMSGLAWRVTPEERREAAL